MTAMTAVALDVRQNTPEWLEMRRDGIGSSDIPVITGNRAGLLSLWAVKCRLLEPEIPDADTQEMFDLGHALEPIIAARYEAKTGRKVQRVNRMLRHPSVEWAFASLDRRSGRRAIELKWAPNRRWTDGPEPIPGEVQDQVQWQLMVTGYPVADVAVLNGSRVDIHEIEADRGYQDDLLFLASDFRGYVERQERPPVDGSDATRRTLARLHPREEGTITAPALEMDALAAELREAKERARDAADNQGSIENAIRAVLGDAPGVEGNGYRITWTKNANSARTDWKLAFAELQVVVNLAQSLGIRLGGNDNVLDVEEIVTRHTQTVEGPRVLRAKFKGESGKWL